MRGNAIISDDGVYRYILSRKWSKKKSTDLLFIGVNPSTADATENDRTIEKLIKFASLWGYGGFTIVNLFAYRATKPRHLMERSKVRGIPYVVGPENKSYLKGNIKKAEKVVCMWGNSGDKICPETSWHVYNMIPDEKRFCFGYTNQDAPTHPLYLPDETQLRKFNLIYQI